MCLKCRKYDYDSILAFIIYYKRVSDGLSPTYREIMKEFKMTSTSTLHHILNTMMSEGTIIKTPRGIMVDGGEWTWRRP